MNLLRKTPLLRRIQSSRSRSNWGSRIRRRRNPIPMPTTKSLVAIVLTPYFDKEKALNYDKKKELDPFLTQILFDSLYSLISIRATPQKRVETKKKEKAFVSLLFFASCFLSAGTAYAADDFSREPTLPIVPASPIPEPSPTSSASWIDRWFNPKDTAGSSTAQPTAAGPSTAQPTAAGPSTAQPTATVTVAQAKDELSSFFHYFGKRKCSQTFLRNQFDELGLDNSSPERLVELIKMKNRIFEDHSKGQLPFVPSRQNLSSHLSVPRSGTRAQFNMI